MDQNIVQPEQSTIDYLISTPSPPGKRKTLLVLTIIGIASLFLSIGAAGYYFYQKRLINKDITNQAQISPTPDMTATSFPIITPTITFEFTTSQKPSLPSATPTPSFSATIDGYLYFDENNNNNRESYEKGAMGKTIIAWEKTVTGVQFSASNITNDDGYFKIMVKKTGTYLVNLSSSETSINYIDPANRQVIINKNLETQRVNIAWVPRGKSNQEQGPNEGVIQGITFSDDNRNGVKDNGENGIYFFKINLYKLSDNSFVSTTVSDNNGSFTFTNLTLTSYKIEAYNPSGQYTITKSSTIAALTQDHKLDNTAQLGVIKNY